MSTHLTVLDLAAKMSAVERAALRALLDREDVKDKSYLELPMGREVGRYLVAGEFTLPRTGDLLLVRLEPAGKQRPSDAAKRRHMEGQAAPARVRGWWLIAAAGQRGVRQECDRLGERA